MILKESQCLYKRPGKQSMYMHQVIYNNKLENKCTLTPLDPRLLYMGPHTLKDTYPIGTPDLIHTATCLYYEYYVQLHVVLQGTCLLLCSIGQLLTCTMQCQATSNAHYSDSSVLHNIFILFATIFIKIIQYCNMFWLLD